METDLSKVVGQRCMTCRRMDEVNSERISGRTARLQDDADPDFTAEIDSLWHQGGWKIEEIG